MGKTKNLIIEFNEKENEQERIKRELIDKKEIFEIVDYNEFLNDFIVKLKQRLIDNLEKYKNISIDEYNYQLMIQKPVIDNFEKHCKDLIKLI